MTSAAFSAPTIGHAVAQEERRDFTIPAGDLRAALASFGRQANFQLAYRPAVAAGRTSAGVQGAAEPSEALARLLSGTGLSYRMTSARSAVIEDPVPVQMTSSGEAENGSTVLDPIDVIGDDRVSAADAPYRSPGSTHHISSEQLARVPANSVGDIFKSAPGVISAGNRIGSSLNVNIRGLQGQSRVNVMVDGTRQSGGSYRGYSGSRDEVFVDPDFLVGADIEKGPSGGEGGVGAMGGVINLRTLEAKDIVKDGQTYGARVKASLGSWTKSPPSEATTAMRNDAPGFFNGDSWSGSLAAGVSEEAYDLVAAFSRRKSGNYFAGRKGKSTFTDARVPFSPVVERRMSAFGPGEEVFNTSQDVTSFLVKGGFRWGDGHSVKLGYTRYENTFGENYETLLNFALPGGFLFIPAAQRGLSKVATDTLTAEYKWRPEGNDLIDAAAHLWLSDLDSTSDVSLALGAGNPNAKGDVRVRTYGGDLSNTSSFDTPIGRLTTKYGTEFVMERARGEPIDLGFQLLSINPNGNREMASVFDQTKLEITRWLSVSGGLRYDHYWSKGAGSVVSAAVDDMSGGRVNPSVRVTVEPLQGVQFFGAYVEGWRPPSLRETAAIGAGGIIANGALKPELSKNFEFGVNVSRDGLFRENDKLRVKAVRFDNNYDDYIYRFRGPNLNYSWANVDKAEFSGFELSAQYDAGFAFVEAAFTRYDHVKFCNAGVCGFGVVGEDYGVMTIPPKYTATLTGGVRLFDQKLTLGGRLYFIGERFGGYGLAAGAVNAPTYWAKNTIVDLFGSYNFTEEVSLDVSAENIGDRYYLDPLANGLVASPGRTIRTSLTARF